MRTSGTAIEQTIAVGDADNDTMALKTAGLAVAMGNATEPIKALADVIVADCDHNGCAEAIDKYLLADNSLRLWRIVCMNIYTIWRI